MAGGEEISTAASQRIHFYLSCATPHIPFQTKSCGDALSAYPVNTTFTCCYQTTPSGKTVDGEIREGTADDWKTDGTTSEYKRDWGIAWMVIGGVVALCPMILIIMIGVADIIQSRIRQSPREQSIVALV